MADPADTVWRFRDTVGLEHIEKALRAATFDYSRHSTTVSYFFQPGESPRLDSYELHAAYKGSNGLGEPLVKKSYLRNSYGILETVEGSRWIAETNGEKISELDFYEAVLYSSPDRMLSLQQLSFETGAGRYLVELNIESKLLVLISLNGMKHIPGALSELISDEELCRADYLLELFRHNGGPLVSS